VAIKSYKPTSPGRRSMTTAVQEGLSPKRPEKGLTGPRKQTGGRNNLGHITAYHRGGGHKRLYRIVDFRRDKVGVPAQVAALEYDPNRSANLALLHYADGEKRYILAPHRLQVGDRVIAGEDADIRPGNCLSLRNIPLGTIVHNLELKQGKGGQMIRAAGGYGQLMAKEGNYALIRMPSGEDRLVHQDCRATVGQVGNLDHASESIGKAGRKRWMGRRPITRGVAMNPVDHPHGGGEGRTSGGGHPVTPWGVPTKGKKTRKHKPSDKYIVRRRSKK